MIDRLKELLARQPFCPFRVMLANGNRYEVHRRDFAFLMKGGLYIGLPANVEDDLPERAVFCSAQHLAGVEPLSAP